VFAVAELSEVWLFANGAEPEAGFARYEAVFGSLFERDDGLTFSSTSNFGLSCLFWLRKFS
jgi:hypothetical protein